jgi:hypothetical protein
MWTCCRSTSSEVAAKRQLLLFSFRSFCFCLVEEVCNICTLSREDLLFSSRGRLSGSPLDPRSVRFLTRRTHVLCFLTCNISQFFPSTWRPSSFFLSTFLQLRRSYATPMLSIGGIVFEVAFGGVSDSVGTGRIECARATPVTYRHDQR